MSLSVTPQAAAQIRKALTLRGGGVGLRIAVKTSGCSGYAYALEFADTAGADDQLFETEGVSLLVDAHSLPLVDGTQLDWVREGLNEGFKFHNPNATANCGCDRVGEAAWHAAGGTSPNISWSDEWRCCRSLNPAGQRRPTSPRRTWRRRSCPRRSRACGAAR